MKKTEKKFQEINEKINDLDARLDEIKDNVQGQLKDIGVAMAKIETKLDLLNPSGKNIELPKQEVVKENIGGVELTEENKKKVVEELLDVIAKDEELIKKLEKKKKNL